MIDGKKFFDQPINSHINYENIKISEKKILWK